MPARPSDRAEDSPPHRRLRIESFSPVDIGQPQGDALHLRGFLDALAARGHDVRLWTRKPSSPSPPTARFSLRAVAVPRWRALEYGLFEVAGARALLAACARRRPDVIHARLDMYSAAPGFVRRALRIPLIVEVNASIPVELRLAGRRAAAMVAAQCERTMLRRADRILVLDAALGREIVARAGADPERVRVLPIATRLPLCDDGATAATRAAAGAGDATFVIGFAGNLARIQGIDTLIRAVHALGPGDRVLWVIGAGAEEGALRRLAATGEGTTCFFGGRSAEETDRLLSACQVLVAPYRRPDYDLASGGGALSSKVMHYLACDRPVLVSDVPGYAWIEEERLGERFTANDALSLAAKLEDAERRWRGGGLSGGGRKWIERKGRTWDHAAARFEEIVREVLPPRSASAALRPSARER